MRIFTPLALQYHAKLRGLVSLELKASVMIHVTNDPHGKNGCT